MHAKEIPNCQPTGGSPVYGMYQIPAEALLTILIFMLAGVVKGVSGMGLPTVAIGLLGLMMVPAEAVALLIVPSLITNVWQFAAGSNRFALLRRMWPMLIAISVTTWAGASMIVGGSARHATALLGATLIVYAIIGLAKFQLSISRDVEAWLAPVIGTATGLITGATGVFVIPAVPFLQALGLEKDDLVQALGLSFTVSTLALAAGLATHDAFHVSNAGVSLLYTGPALVGMVLGQRIRLGVDPKTFRMLFFLGLLALGGDLLARSLL